MESLFLALADKTRLRLLNLLRQDEVSVNLLTEILDESQPKISRHLAYLRNAGIIEPRREGKQIFYRLIAPNDKSAEFILDDLLDWLEKQPRMQIEYGKLLKRFPDKKFVGKGISEENGDTFKPNIYAESHISQKREELPIFLL